MGPRRKSSICVSKPDTPSTKAVNFSTRFSLNAFIKRVDKLTPAQKNAIIRSGFGHLLVIGNHMISKNLLVELMEKWHVQKTAFVLKGETIRVTPLDVALILGLRVVGRPVNIELDLPFIELETEYGAALWNRKITVGSIEARLEALGESDDDGFVRSFLLFTFGTILFPNTTGKVDSRYLCLLQDVESIGKFAWGAAVLDDLVNWLCKRKENKVQYVGGCLILLQIWSYEHIDIGRPSLRNQSDITRPTLGNQAMKFPRACRWENNKSRKRDWFILQFRNLQSHQMSLNLDLTLEELESELVKELLISQKEMEDCSNQLMSSPNIKSNSMGSLLSSQSRSYFPQEKHNLDSTVYKVDPSNDQGDAVLANEKHDTEKQKADVISISSDVSDNQIGVVENVNICQQQVWQKCYSYAYQSRDLTLTSMRDQHSSEPACCSPQGKQFSISIASSDMSDNQGDDVLANNDSSKQELVAIKDLALPSTGDQRSSPFTPFCLQPMQKHNSNNLSSDDDEEKSTLEDRVMEREISELRMENNDLKKEIEEKDQKLSEATKIEQDNMKLRKEVETLKHQYLLHLSAFKILNEIVFSQTDDEGTNNTRDEY